MTPSAPAHANVRFVRYSRHCSEEVKLPEGVIFCRRADGEFQVQADVSTLPSERPVWGNLGREALRKLCPKCLRKML